MMQPESGPQLFPSSKLERAKPSRPAAKNRANLLDGKTWTKYSISIWSDIRKNREETSLHHPAIFPVDLAKRLIEVFLPPKGAVVLDPFVGIGSTVLAAQDIGKNGIGVEISEKYVDIARRRLANAGLFRSDRGSGAVHLADARNLLQIVDPGSIDLVVTSPPYWDILLQKRTADYKAQREYESGEADLGKIRSYPAFLKVLSYIFADVHLAMRPRSYCCVVVMDLRKKDRFYP
ncbi:MAG: DNA methyltransferase, partial [Candidatus Binataceae bacterium]